MSRPTMETVAERAGVSRALVSLVMNNSSKVSEAKRQAVLHAAEQLGYRPNLHARNLAQARTKTLGMIINDIHNPFFAEVVYGVEAAADDYGFDVLIDDGLKPWLVEVNAAPSFVADTPKDAALKKKVVSDVLDVLDMESVVMERYGGGTQP